MYFLIVLLDIIMIIMSTWTVIVERLGEIYHHLTFGLANTSFTCETDSRRDLAVDLIRSGH